MAGAIVANASTEGLVMKPFIRRQSCSIGARTGPTSTAAVLVALIGIAFCPSAAAQDPEDPAADARFKRGPLAISPSIAIGHFGVDSNVFNDAEDPKSDFTASVIPQMDLWLRLGRGQLSVNSGMHAIYFKEHSGQGSVGTANTGKFELLFNRIRPYAAGSFLRVNERPSVEIDTRAERRQSAVELGAELRLTPKLAATIGHKWGDIEFDEDAAFLDQNIGTSLDRRERIARASLGYDITPLTRAALDVQHEQTMFTQSPERDGQGLRVTTGFDFKPHALISGGLRLGVLDYRSDAANGPAFTGFTAAVDLRYAGLEHTEIAAGVNRDLQYSIDGQSYYVQTGVTVGATRQITDRWSLSTSVSQLWLDYSLLNPATVTATEVSPRPDQVVNVSLGVSRRVNHAARVGFTAAYVRRDAADPTGSYDGMRLFGTLAFGTR